MKISNTTSPAEKKLANQTEDDGMQFFLFTF